MLTLSFLQTQRGVVLRSKKIKHTFELLTFVETNY